RAVPSRTDAGVVGSSSKHRKASAAAVAASDSRPRARLTSSARAALTSPLKLGSASQRYAVRSLRLQAFDAPWTVAPLASSTIRRERAPVLPLPATRCHLRCPRAHDVPRSIAVTSTPAIASARRNSSRVYVASIDSSSSLRHLPRTVA